MVRLVLTAIFRIRVQNFAGLKYTYGILQIPNKTRGNNFRVKLREATLANFKISLFIFQTVLKYRI